MTTVLYGADLQLQPIEDINTYQQDKINDLLL